MCASCSLSLRVCLTQGKRLQGSLAWCRGLWAGPWLRCDLHLLWEDKLRISPFYFLGTVEVINARETVPRGFPHDLLSGCAAGLPIGKDTDWAMRALCAPGMRCTKFGVGRSKDLADFI